MEIRRYTKKFIDQAVVVTGLVFVIIFVAAIYVDMRSTREVMEASLTSSHRRISYLASLGDFMEISRLLQDQVRIGLVEAVSLQNGERSIRFGVDKPTKGFRLIQSCLSDDISHLCFSKTYYPPWGYFIALCLLMIILVVVRKVLSSFAVMISNEIMDLKKSFRSIELLGIYEPFFDELKEFKAAFLELFRLQFEADIAKSKEESADKMLSVFKQLSHDIRSPLAALEMINGSIDSIPEEKRIVVRSSINRIRDIANSLLRSGEAKWGIIAGNEIAGMKLEPVLLSAAIDSIVSEKRFQFREKLDVRIEYEYTKDSYGLFANLDLNQFKRVLSNLINNGVEAISTAGVVRVFLRSSGIDTIDLFITDNGKGISKEILPSLGIRGLSHGKEEGSGLGLHHAKTWVERWGGRVEILSQEGRGSDVILHLPRASVPGWFLEKVLIRSGMTVIIFDDDHSIHQIWRGRFQSSIPSQLSVELIHATTANDLRVLYGRLFQSGQDTLYLMDYEIAGSPTSGLDLIEELGLQKDAILVTSRYEEPSIRDRCVRQGVRLIPKPISGFVPLEIS